MNKTQSNRPAGKLVWLVLLTLLFTLLGGCGNNTDEETGEVIIGITDAPGDFLNYTVDVTRLSLTKANGTEVDVLPLQSRIDFSQLTEMTEFFTIATIPSGQYVKATMTLDYSDPDVQVEDGSGNAVSVEVKDSSGNPLTSAEVVTVNLSNANAVVIAPGVPAHLTLDFDLNASHNVDTTVTPPEVVAEPVLVADVGLTAPKPYRVRGLLSEVNQAGNKISLNIRPFFKQSGRFGTLDAYVNNASNYDIDGESYSGSDGLAQLAQMPAASWVVVYGEMNKLTRRFMASEIYAGTSVLGSNEDMVTGVVLSRSDDTLVVNAGSIVRTTGNLILNKNVTVALDAATTVSRQLSSEAYSTNDISVGQRVLLLGTLEEDAQFNLSMTSPSVARMLINQVTGTVVSTGSSELVVDLQRINGRLPMRFDFSDTGSTGNDADPDNYQIDVTGLSLSQLEAGDPVKVRGFVSAFGAAPPDFAATTVIDVANVPAVMLVGWGLGTTTPFTSQNSDRLVLTDGTGLFHHVSRAGVAIDLNANATDTSLVPPLNGRGVYIINQAGSLYLFPTFSEFVDEVGARLGSYQVQRIWALGTFEDNSETMTANIATVVMRPLN